MLVVDFAKLGIASNDIQHALNTMRQQLQDLEDAARPLVDNWSGDAKAAYEVRQNKWRQAANDLTQLLQSIKRALDESLEEYAATERGNAQMFGG